MVANLKSMVALGILSVSGLVNAEFLKDSQAQLSYKNYYYNNDNRNGAADPSKIAEWGHGLTFGYQSGYTQGVVGFGLDALGMVGMKLDSGKGRHLGSSMMPTESDGRGVDEWSRLGITGKAKFRETSLFYGTLRPSLPVILTNDARVLTQTYQGGQIVIKDLPQLTFTGGRITRATARASTDRTGLAITGGTEESDGFTFAGADWTPQKSLKLQYYFGQLDDYYTQHFLGAVHQWDFSEGQLFKTDLRYFHTSSSGRNSQGTAGYRISGFTRDGNGEIDNETWSAMGVYGFSSHTLTAGYQVVSGGSNFPQVAQGSLPDKGAVGSTLYLFTDRLIQSFNRAGERTYFGQYAYDFAGLGAPGLRASLTYLKGSDIKTDGGNDLREWERDFIVDYAVQSGLLKGLGVAWLNGKSNSEVSRNQDQNRVILSYTIPIL
jgi:hypothetical protein